MDSKNSIREKIVTQVVTLFIDHDSPCFSNSTNAYQTHGETDATLYIDGFESFLYIF
jgi:hypothetical protein